jgi:parallel beta-helix repeat protein
MNKFTPIKMWLLLVCICFTVSSVADSYCESGSFGNQIIWNDAVASGSVVNITGQSMFPYIDDQDRLYMWYSRYFNPVFEWQVGLNPMTLVPGLLFTEYPAHWRVWIDVNQDHQFNENELFLDTSSTETWSGDVDLSDLILEQDMITRMRVTTSAYADVPPCGSIGHGEVEDYQLSIKAPVITTVQVPSDYASIQAAIDYAPAGMTISVDDGIYHENLSVWRPVTIESINGAAHTTIRTTNEDHTIHVDAPGVTIKGFTITGSGSVMNAGVFFAAGADGGQALELTCGISTTGESEGAFVLIQGADDVKVSDSYCVGQGRFGIYAENSSRSLFSNNQFSYQERSGIEVNNGEDIVINNNQLNHNALAGALVNQSLSVEVSDNDCSHQSRLDPNSNLSVPQGIRVDDSSLVELTRNRCMDNDYFGIYVQNSDQVVISENQASLNRQLGLHISKVNDITISNNDFTDNLVFGVRVLGSILQANYGLFIEGNLLGNQSNYGLHVRLYDHSLIKGNQFIGSGLGMFLEQADASTIRTNTFQMAPLTEPACMLRLLNSSQNYFYANEFNFILEPDSFCSQANSQNHWFSPVTQEYVFMGELYNGYIGNYYLNADHTDLDTDGIAENSFQLPEGETIDLYPMSQPLEFYEILE